MALIELQQLRKTYQMGEENVHALDGVTLNIEECQFVSILGPSGSGKSTLMHMLGFMDKPTGGRMLFDGDDVTDINVIRRAWYRANRIGFVFQAFNLLPRLSVVDNVLLPVTYSRLPENREGAAQRALEALERVGLSHRAKHLPSQLSGGERQRVAIARALINRPRLILADEPTGNLDSKNVDRILSLFGELKKEGQTIIMVTHDLYVSSYAERVISMRDGKVERDFLQTPRAEGRQNAGMSGGRL